MQTITQITQPQPCHQSWDSMSAVENGRFCSSCSKAVVDFTTMTNQQIIDHLSASAGNLCGRISTSQFNEVNYQLAKPAPAKAGIWKRLMLTLTMLASLSYVKGQTGVEKAKTEQAPVNLITGEVVMVAAPVKYITLTGTVTDNKGAPIEQATVSAGKQSIQTNVKGEFKLQVPAGTKSFQLRFIGFETTTVKINKKPGKPYNIKMNMAGMYLGGLGAVKRPNTVKKILSNLFGQSGKSFWG